MSSSKMGGHNKVLVLVVSAVIHIFPFDQVLKLIFLLQHASEATPCPSLAVFSPRGICERQPAVPSEHLRSALRGGRAGVQRGSSSLCLEGAAQDKAPLRDISCE